MKHTPLEIALQEYTYWRGAESENPHWMDIQIGAIGAAANIAARLTVPDKPLVGISYRTHTPAEITRALTEIQLAPRIANALHQVHRFLVEKLDTWQPGNDAPESERASYTGNKLHELLDPLIEELKEHGVVTNSAGESPAGKVEQ